MPYIERPLEKLYYSIGEVAEILGESTSLVRFWDGYGNTSPFICFGLVDYISSKGDKPMQINWKMHHPILPEFILAV